MNLKEILDVFDDHEQFDWFVRRSDGSLTKVTFYDEYGLSFNPEEFYLFGFEYGPTHLIHAKGESDAYECWIDLLPTIPREEIHEAYGAYDKLRELMTSKGHEDDRHLRDFCNRWCKFYFEADTKNPDEATCDRWPLIEGYQMQSNSTGTGIVDVGHCEWMQEIEPKDIEVVRKVAVNA